MKRSKILFLAHDPGGANALIPLVNYMSDLYHTYVYAVSFACSEFDSAGVKYRKINDEIKQIDLKSIEQWLKILAPDFVVTGTSSDDFTEKYIWHTARILNIPTMAILDSWCNYGERFSRYAVKEKKHISYDDLIYMPNWIVAMDEYAKSMLVKAGVNRNVIVPLGHPYLETIVDSFHEITTEDVSSYKKRIGADGRRIIMFASDNISEAYPSDGQPFWGYDEKTIYKNIENAIINNKCNYDDYLLVVRPHPKENRKYWNRIIAESSLPITTIVDRSVSSAIAIKASDLVIGMWTMFLVESVLGGTPIMCLEIGATQNAPFILKDRGLIDAIVSQEELDTAWRKYLQNKWNGIVEWELERNATERIASFIMGEIEVRF